MSNEVHKARYCGTIAAFNLKITLAYGAENSLALRQRFLTQGLLIPPLGDVIYFLPPYCMTEAELTRAYQIILEETLGVLS